VLPTTKACSERLQASRIFPLNHSDTPRRNSKVSRRQHSYCKRSVSFSGFEASRRGFAKALVGFSSMWMQTSSAARAGGDEDVDFKYWRLWVSTDGHTHISQTSISDFEMKGYSKAPQAVRERGIPEPVKTVFTQLPRAFDNPWHYCPTSQFVFVTKGSWWIQTTDGTRVTLGTNDLLYQDNSEAVAELLGDVGLENAGKHASGTDDDLCQQVIVQVKRDPVLNENKPF